VPDPDIDDDVLELTDDMVDDFGLEPEPAPRPAPVPAMAPPAIDDFDEAPLVEASVAAVSSNFLSELTESLSGRDIPIGDGSLTLETLVRQIVRELVKQWLDENLPEMTERLVQREVERLAKSARKR